MRISKSLLWLVVSVAGPALSQQPTRFVEVIEVDPRDGHVNVNVQFNCTLRYAGHTPGSEGAELRVRLRPGPDCGGVASISGVSELANLLDEDSILTSARLEENAPGELTLSFAWSHAESFVLAQGADTRGLRIRLLNRTKRDGKVTVAPSTDVLANYAINLESRLEPFDAEAVARAASLMNLPAFVSTVELEGETWHRLRVGPLDRRSIAEQALRVAATHYPRAWLAIADDAQTNDPNAIPREVLPAVEPIGADAPLEAAERKSLLARARKSLSARDPMQAITLLTKLQRQREFPERAQVQELLALARERSGQLAHAKAEYEEYLRRYPDGPAVERVRMRLRILRAAGDEARSQADYNRRARGWNVAGGFAQLYRRDESRLEEADAAIDSVNQNAVFNDASLIARRRGNRFDVAARASAGYAKDLLPEGPGDQVRVSTAWLEVNDRALGLGARLGRQSRASAGVLGSFDGLAVAYEFRPAWSLGAAAGLPVESSRNGPDSQRRFTAMSITWAPDSSQWSASAFLASQQYEGVRDRQAVGIEATWFVPGRSLVGVIDYDLEFDSLNAAVLIGTLQLPARWTITFDLERRNSPVLTTRNALIGQPVSTLDQLLGTFTQEELFGLARDRTGVLSSYSLSATRPLGERFHLSLDVIGSRFAGTAASGGVDAQPPTGFGLSYQVQLFAGSVLRPGDLNVLGLRQEDSDLGQTTSLSLTSRVPVRGAWRVGPRLRADQRRSDALATTERVVTPSLRLDCQRNGRLLELEVGAELSDRARLDGSSSGRRYFLSAGYRVSF